MYASLFGISIVSTSDVVKSFVWEHAISFRPLVELLVLKSLEAVRQIFTECVVIFVLTHEADFLAEIEVEFDIGSNEVHALQRVCTAQL